MRLLVAGAARVDAGKTTFSTGLVERTDAMGFKPRAGNDFWFDHDDVRRAVSDGRLYGKDAKRLAGASAREVDAEDVNPVHRLWRPSPGGAKGLLGQEDREFVVDRVGGSFIVNGAIEVPDLVREHLPLSSATAVGSLSELNDAMETLHVAAFQRSQEQVSEAERAVVESYSDIALPIQEFEPDAVAVVEPRRCRVYPGDRYVRARQVASGSAHEGKLEERVRDVTELVETEATVELPALPDDQRADPGAVADAYEEAYSRLLDVAGV